MIDHRIIHACETPAFIIDLRMLRSNTDSIKRFATSAGCKTLYSMKALTLRDTLTMAAEQLDGFSTSSLCEARLAREIGGNDVEVSHVSPLVRETEVREIGSLCDTVIFNSLSQLDRFSDQLGKSSRIGIRINPRQSFAADEKSDPCRHESKLGVPLETFAWESHRFDRISGLHFHTNRHSHNAHELIATIELIENHLSDQLGRFEWLNVGGGYMFDDDHSNDAASKKLRQIRDRYDLETIIEPGSALVATAGCFVSAVQDLTQNNTRSIALLDTTVNHWPELFEYQLAPTVEDSVADGHEYLLAGCSCVPGDVFGVHAFANRLSLGDRMVFSDAGAYSIAKANTFNGIDLPNIYVVDESGELERVKQFTYEEFISRCGIESTRQI